MSEFAVTDDIRTKLREQMLLPLLLHVKMARVQRVLYQHVIQSLVQLSSTVYFLDPYLTSSRFPNPIHIAPQLPKCMPQLHSQKGE